MLIFKVEKARFPNIAAIRFRRLSTRVLSCGSVADTANKFAVNLFRESTESKFSRVVPLRGWRETSR